MHYRLPDQLLLDIQAYARLNGVSVTDVIIQGLNVVLGEGMKGQTVYEADEIKPIKVPKQSVKKEAAPMVKSLLAGVNVSPTVQHHPRCKCGVCNS